MEQKHSMGTFDNCYGSDKSHNTLLMLVLFLIIFMSLPLSDITMHDSNNFIKHFYGAFCHQKPDRCLQVFGYKTYLCTRCFSFYIGMFSCLIACRYGNSQLPRTIANNFILLNLPLVLDGTSQALSLRESNNYLRFATGMLAGIGCAAVLYKLKPKVMQNYSLKSQREQLRRMVENLHERDAQRDAEARRQLDYPNGTSSGDGGGGACCLVSANK